MLSHRNSLPFFALALFLGLFFALQISWEFCRGTLLEHWVIDSITVVPSAWIVNAIWPQQFVAAEGNSLISSQGQLNILNGCEGLEVLFLLIAAFLAYPFGWRRRLLGIAAGTVFVYGLNQVRIVVLWEVILRRGEWFGLFHGVILPLALVTLCAFFFLLFLPKHADPT